MHTNLMTISPFYHTPCSLCSSYRLLPYNSTVRIHIDSIRALHTHFSKMGCTAENRSDAALGWQCDGVTRPTRKPTKQQKLCWHTAKHNRHYPTYSMVRTMSSHIIVTHHVQIPTASSDFLIFLKVIWLKKTLRQNSPYHLEPRLNSR